MEEFYTYLLPNGIRGIHRQVKSRVAHCALVINAGSRDELPNGHGLAHFIEHGFFKGTARRKAWQVNCRLENLGGELNAFTTKEDTTIHATVLRGDFSKAVELIADIALHSTFPERELDREREVIADEINTYKDSPADLIYDSFEDLLFEGSELGHGILGTKQTLRGFDGEAICDFRRRTHTTDQMVFASIGALTPKAVENIVLRYFGEAPATTRDYRRTAPQPVAPFDRTVRRHTHQTHCIVGCPAPDIDNPSRLAMSLLVNILGGPSANSLLNISIREKHGLSYNVEAGYTPYVDAGIMAVYFSCDHQNVEQCLELVDRELHGLMDRPLTARHLSMAKKQFIAQLAISTESNESYMLGVGKSLLVHNEVDPLEEVYRKIEAMTAAELQEVARAAFGNCSRLIYK